MEKCKAFKNKGNGNSVFFLLLLKELRGAGWGVMVQSIVFCITLNNAKRATLMIQDYLCRETLSQWNGKPAQEMPVISARRLRYHFKL